MEKNVELSYLMDYYGPFLTSRQRVLMEMHVNQDLSLSEIAELEGISRQGVHDSLKRAETMLYDMEKRLKLLEKMLTVAAKLKLLQKSVSDLSVSETSLHRKQQITAQIDEIISALED